MSKKDMNKDVGEVFQSVVESVKQKRKEAGDGGVGKLLGSMVNRKKDKKVKRKFKQIEKGILLLIGAVVAGYASNVLIITKVDEQMNQTQDIYRQSQSERTEVQALLDNQEATEEHIQEMQQQLEEVGNKYPNYRTENEILIVLNDLFAPSGVSVSSIAVTPSVQVQKAEISALISQKGLAEYVENAEYFNTGAAAEQPASGSAAEEGTEAAARETKFDVTEVTFSVNQITREQALGLAQMLYSSPRILIPKNLSIIGSGGEDNVYSLQGTLMFYSYRISEDTESLV